VADVAVVGAPDAHWGETVAAFVVRQPGGLIDEATIVSHCQQQLAGFKKPRVVRFVPSLPRTTLNKISKAALRKLLVEEQSAREPPTRPYREV